LQLSERLNDIDDIKLEYFSLINYSSHSSI